MAFYLTFFFGKLILLFKMKKGKLMHSRSNSLISQTAFGIYWRKLESKLNKTGSVTIFTINKQHCLHLQRTRDTIMFYNAKYKKNKNVQKFVCSARARCDDCSWHFWSTILNCFSTSSSTFHCCQISQVLWHWPIRMSTHRLNIENLK